MSKRIKGITIEISASTQGLDKALQDVNKSSRDINKELRDVNKLLRFNPKDTELLAQKQKLLGDQVSTTREKLDRLKQAEAEVQAQFERGDIGEEQYRAFKREVVETESKLKHYENQLKQVSDSHLILSRNLQDTGKKMQDVGKKVSDVGGDLTKKLTVPLAGVGAAASKLGIDFESSMSEVQAVTGATGEELQQLENAAREAGATTNKSARDAADALKYMGLAGWDVTDSQKALMPMLKLSSAGNMELGRTTDLVTDSMSALGLGIDDLDDYLDILAQTSRNSNTDIDALGEAFVVVGGRLNLLEIDAKDAAVALGILGDNGIKGSEAGRGLNAVLTNLTAPTGQAKKALDELGISAFDSSGKFIGLEETFQLVKDATAGMTQEQQNMYYSMIAGKEHGKTFNALLGSLGDGWDNLAGDVANANGALDEMYDTMTDNTAGAVDNLKSALEELGLKIWDNLKPSIDWLVDKLQGVTDKLNSLSPETQEMIVRIGLIVAAIGPVLLIIGKLITVVGTITATMGKLIGIAKGVGLAIGALSGPVGLAIGGIAALGIGAIALGKHMSQDALPEVERFGEGVSETTQEAVGSFMDMTEEANVQLKELSWGQQEVTAEMAEDMRTKQEEITNTLLSAIDSRHQEELSKTQEQFANLDALTEEQQAGILEKINQRYEDEKIITEEGHNRINEIMQNAAEEGRAITQEEADEILKIREGMTEQAVKVMSENELEQKLILEKMKSNAETISAQEAAEVVRNATKKKDDVIKEANDQYDETYKWAIRQRDELGTLSDEEAAEVIEAARKQRDESISAAEEMHNKVVSEAQAQAGEHVNQVDWETGEVLSKWEVLKRNTSTKFKQMKDNAVQKAKDMARDAKNSFEDLRKSASEKFGNVATTIRDKMDDARKWVDEKIEAIKEFFTNLKLKLPKIEVPPLPKFSLEGSFSLNPPSVPKLSVTWNADGAIFTKPTIFGTSQGLQGVGEAGAEAVLPISKLSGILADTLDKAGYSKVNQNEPYKGREIVQHITINSPKELSPSEVARQTKNATRALAMEW